MYSNNIVNFQESTTILTVQKKSGNLLNAPRIYGLFNIKAIVEKNSSGTI